MKKKLLILSDLWAGKGLSGLIIMCLYWKRYLGAAEKP